MKALEYISSAVFSCLAIAACHDKNEYLPPEWNYKIPDTKLTGDTQLGAFYNIYTTADWTSYQGYTPVLSITEDEGEATGIVPYTATQDGILISQCALARKAGLDFFVIPYNAGTAETGFLSAWEYYLDELSDMKLVINYNFSHLKLSDVLYGEGEDFNRTISDFGKLYASLFSKDWYYRMPDGRPVIIVSGMKSAKVDWESFLPAFREEMARIEDGKGMDFYIIGENTSNWAAPVTNADAEKWLDANYVKTWYPSTYYERWYFFYSYTDLAWQNWVKYASDWGNDYVPCIYPEYRKDDAKARFMDRTAENYMDFCNVAKRNMGRQSIILINSWNDFSTDSALEPTLEYGEEYLEITRSQLKP